MPMAFWVFFKQFSIIQCIHNFFWKTLILQQVNGIKKNSQCEGQWEIECSKTKKKKKEP